MVALVGEILLWLAFAFSALQATIFVCLVIWGIWTDSIKPRLIPQSEIDREADAIVAGYPDPDEEAFGRYERAWSRSERAEQVYWQRVRKAIRRQRCPT